MSWEIGVLIVFWSSVLFSLGWACKDLQRKYKFGWLRHRCGSCGGIMYDQGFTLN